MTAKFSEYYFYINTSKYRDFHICISVPLNFAWEGRLKSGTVESVWTKTGFALVVTIFWFVNKLIFKDAEVAFHFPHIFVSYFNIFRANITNENYGKNILSSLLNWISAPP